MAAICNGCGHENTRDTYCENCGARLSTDAPDASFEEASLSLMLGLVCDACDTYNDPGSSHCFSCGVGLANDADEPDVAAPIAPAAEVPAAVSPSPTAAAQPLAAPSWMSAPEGSPLATVNAMKAVDLGEIATVDRAGLKAPTGSVPPIEAEALDDDVVAPKDVSPVADTLKTARPSPEALAGAAPSAPEPLATPEPVAAATVSAKAAVPGASCPSCHSAILADDVFCRHCGTKMGQGPAKTAVMSAVNPSPSAAPQAAMTTAMPSVNIGATPQSATMFFGAATVERFARLLLLKGHTQLGTQWRLQSGETTIGRSKGAVLFPDDAYLSQEHCKLVFTDDALWMHPAPSANGVFVKIVGQVEVDDGDAFVIGQQHFTVAAQADRQEFLPPASDGTAICSAALPNVDRPIFLRRRGGRPELDETYLRAQRILTIGRSGCDLSFAQDPYISTRHAQLIRGESGLTLEDLQSRNGTFLHIKEPMQLKHGDQVMMGEQVLRVEIVSLK